MPAVTTSELEQPRADITPLTLVFNDYGGDVSTRFGLRWRLLDPDRASSMFSPQQTMVDLMKSGLRLTKSVKIEYDEH